MAANADTFSSRGRMSPDTISTWASVLCLVVQTDKDRSERHFAALHIIRIYVEQESSSSRTASVCLSLSHCVDKWPTEQTSI